MRDIAAAAVNVKSAVIDVSGISDAAIFWDFAPVANTATPAATELCIQGSQKAAGDANWVNIQSWLSPTMVPDVLTQNAGGGIGDATISTTAGTIATGLYFYVKDGADVGEFVRKASGAAQVHTVEDLFTLAHAAATIYSKGVERFKFDIDLRNVTRMRVVINNNRGTNRNVVSRVALITSAAT